jgi:hypothetical protein
MNNQAIFIVTPEQIGNEDPGTVLRRAVHKQFEDTEHYIAKEELVIRPTHYSKTPRKLRGYMVNQGGVGHAIWFDITDINTLAWTSQ